MAFRLCSVQNIKDRSKGGGDFGTVFDTLLEQIIDSVTLDLAIYCGRADWDREALTEFFNPGENSKRIFVASPPIAASPLIKVWENIASPRVYGDGDLLVLDTDYFIFSKEGIIIKENRAVWAKGLKTVKVSYTGGYLTANNVGAPADLADAAIVQAKERFDRREAGGLAAQSMEGGSLSFISGGANISPQVKQKLQNYIVRSGPF